MTNPPGIREKRVPVHCTEPAAKVKASRRIIRADHPDLNIRIHPDNLIEKQPGTGYNKTKRNRINDNCRGGHDR